MTTLAKNTHLNLLFSQDKAVECNGDGGLFSVKNDANGNRTHEDGIKVAEYDAQDRLTSYKDNSYQYNALGQLTQKTTPNGTDSFNYDVFGNLRGVSLANGDSIEYLIDPRNRRIGKKKNGQITQKLLYQDQLNPIAELYPDNSVKNLFIYADKSNVPSAMERYDASGDLIGKYRLISNHLGSVVMVVNAETGTIEQEIDYDAWGNVLSDTAPNFQPFYFAGGLYDTDTKLTRFGARDYDAETGRWTSKDPIGFAGGLTSLYDYVGGGNPVNFIDPSGFEGEACNANVQNTWRDLLKHSERRPKNLNNNLIQYDSQGYYRKANRWFDKFNPTNVENIYYRSGDLKGRTGDLPKGVKITVRNTSKGG